ncbi:MAG TPA: AmmeMemoRadiSam system protein A [Candidatus Pacearchaeota archaeon]|nr:AmmeMemoRadiSam system protein A [Candidatus Pacearchaeota archaeon]HOK94324.1 AmmeMemoRadiSam system protein A [Candidatus Pacearchaeota archaeon]HPO75320.1 AmmeMemoRadiSam system protein A [Candidatus Pacearchaeota archaeon]
MHPLVSLAKEAVETYTKNGKIISVPKNLPQEFLNKRAGTFVTIEKNGELRGCIGTYLPTKENIAKEVISNAIATATKDDRFGAIREEELPDLSYTVYVLSEPQPVKDFKELDPKKYGIIIQSGFKSGLLLPGLEGVDTVEEQFFITCQKAGIDHTHEPVAVYKFTAKKYVSE